MKKFLKIFFLIIVLSGASYIVYKFFIEPGEGYRSLYLVPENAAFIIEADQPFNAWEKIIHSKPWDLLKSNALMHEIDKNITSVDSLINSKRLLFKILGNRKVMLSAHAYQPGKYDFLYIVDLKKVAKLKSLEDYLGSALGDNYTITILQYHEQKIIELNDIKEKKSYFFTIIRDKLVFTSVYALLKSSVDESDKLTLGRDLALNDVIKKVSGKGLFSIYLNYKYFDDYLNYLIGKPNKYVSNLEDNFLYSGVYFNMDESGLISLEGYTSLNDTSHSLLQTFIRSGKGSVNITTLAPQRVASMIDIGLDDPAGIYNKIIEPPYLLGDNTYQKTLGKLERRLKFSINKNILSWMGDEIALVQTQPSNLGRDNEFAVIFSTKNAKDAAENLDYIVKQIKKNTPVRFKDIEYKDYSIKYLSIPGFFKMLFGKVLSRIEKPYFTIINKYVVFSNHPQTLKNLIDDYEQNKTLSESEDYNKFSNYFSKKSNVYIYLQTPVLFTNLKQFVSDAKWNTMKQNKKYITSFPQIGLQFITDGSLMKMNLSAQFEEQVENYVPVNYTFDVHELYPEIIPYTDTVPAAQQATPDTSVQQSEIIIKDLDAGKQEEYFDNGQLKYSVGLKNGVKHGQFREYYENGTLKIKGKYKNDHKEGAWKYYNENGNLVKEKKFDN